MKKLSSYICIRLQDVEFMEISFKRSQHTRERHRHFALNYGTNALHGEESRHGASNIPFSGVLELLGWVRKLGSGWDKKLIRDFQLPCLFLCIYGVLYRPLSEGFTSFSCSWTFTFTS